MDSIQIPLSETERTELDRRVRLTGQTPEAIVGEIVRRNLAPWEPEEWKALIRRTAGSWKNREDLPEFLAQLRPEGDERLERIES